MFGASCVFLCITGVLSHRDLFSYSKPWNPLRRHNTECEMCYNGNCFTTSDARCEYYAETSNLVQVDVESTEEPVNDDKYDKMLFELMNSAASTSMRCVPFISLYSECTRENICLGCKYCTCNDEGMWTCKEKQQCRPESKITIDRRVIDIVIEKLKKREKAKTVRNKRSVVNTKEPNYNITVKVSYKDLSKWLYGDPNIFEEKTIGSSTSGFYQDINDLEFNDILQSWKIQSTTIPTKQIYAPGYYNHIEQYDEDDKNTEYDPIRIVKRDISPQSNKTKPNVEIDISNYTLTSAQIVYDALYELNLITSKKQKELEELLSIQDNLVKFIKIYNTSIDFNSTVIGDGINNHKIAIYKFDIFEKCVSNLKNNIYSEIEHIIQSEIKNFTNLPSNLNILSNMFKNIDDERNNDYSSKGNLVSQGNEQYRPKYIEPYTNRYFDPITYLNNILKEVNMISTHPQNNSLATLTHTTQKILKRVIKQLYLDDFAVIDLIIHETYNDYESYLENVGVKWDTMMQDIAESNISDKLYRIKLLFVTLKSDIAKIEDIITLIDFARHRRMTVANGPLIEKSISRIKNNLKDIDYKVQQIIKLQNNEKLRQAARTNQNTPVKKSMMQKLKKLFQNSKNDIKNMLRKRFPKSEIIKRIAKQKVNEVEEQRILEYQGTMKKWQQNLNINSRRRKRSTWGFQTFVDKIKSIIPNYLKKKVKPAIDSKKQRNQKRKKQSKSSTIKTSTPLARSN